MKPLIVLITLISLNSFAASEASVEARSALIRKVWNGLNINSMHLVDEFYDDHIHFVDSVGELKGKENMRRYYQGLYQNVTSINFDIYDEIVSENRHVIFWKMTMKTKSLKGGEPIELEGSSIMKFSSKSGKVIFHRDYFDIGAMVYENIPILGSIIKNIKKRLAAHD